MNDYLNIFIDDQYPEFIDKYLNTNTLKRLKDISFYCGCDYTKLYNTKFMYTRYDHSLVVAHMTWHFTHDRVSTIAALLHDVGTPCFAHAIDYLMKDTLNQESSEVKITEIISKDEDLLCCLKKDNVALQDLEDLSKYPILENKSPRLCTDRLDGVLGTNYIWLQLCSCDEVKEIYDNIVVLNNEDGLKELGFSDLNIASKFIDMVINYTKELQGNKDKYVMQYIADILTLATHKNLFNLNDLYIMKEKDIINILNKNFISWNIFENTSKVVCTNTLPSNYYVSVESKKRCVIPLVNNKRIIDTNENYKKIYNDLLEYKDTKYVYVDNIKTLDN